MKTITTKPIALALIALALTHTVLLKAETNVIFFDPFTSSAVIPLNSTAPQDHGGIGSDAWVGPEGGLDLDGSALAASQGSRNAYLPFTPIEGNKYRLSVDMNPTHSGADWLAIGFANVKATDAWFPAGNSSGWFMLRGTDPGHPLHSYTGYCLDGFGALGWHSGLHTLSVILDTTVPNWTFEYFVDGISERGPVPFSTTPDVNPVISYVAIGSYGSAQGTFDNFKLETFFQTEPTKPSIVVTLIDNSTPAFYNGSIGALLNGTSEAFPVEVDPSPTGPCTYFTNAPNLSAAQSVLGDWLSAPPTLPPEYWTPVSVTVPYQWSIGSESAIVYVLEAPSQGLTNVILSIGVDNGIFVWFDGQYLGGVRCPGGIFAGEHEFTIPSVSSGTHYLSLLREDHGTTNGYIVQVTGETDSLPVESSIRTAVEVRWQSEQGTGYQVQSTEDVQPAIWSNLGSPVTGNGSVMSVFDSTARPARYYRVLRIR